MVSTGGTGGMAGVAGGMTTRVRHCGSGAGVTDGMSVVPCGGEKGSSVVRVETGVVAVETVVPGCVGVESIEGVMGTGVVSVDTGGVGTGGETGEIIGGRPEMEPEATIVGMLGRASSEFSQS